MLNNNLTKEIIKRVYSNLGVKLNNSFIQNPMFLQPKTLDFDIFSGKIWSCETNMNENKIQLMFAECSDNSEEYAFISHVEGCPLYGCYLSYGEESEDNLICFSNENNWIISNFFIQSSFLCGMEQMKDVVSGWKKTEDINFLFEKLKLFINYHDKINEE